MINPVPRQLMREHVAEVAARHGGGGDVEITVSVDNGAEIARSTWNPRIGILGGLSILGTTGVVVPYSCSAWIDSIRRGVDVARAGGLTHVAGCTGSTSERTVGGLYELPEIALLDMGDFAGAVLKYIRRHPVDRLTICGGFAKLSKLAAGHLDLHSARSQVDRAFLADLARTGGASEALAAEITEANTGLAALRLCEASRRPPRRPGRRPRPRRVPRGPARRPGRGRRRLHRPGGDGGGPVVGGGPGCVPWRATLGCRGHTPEREGVRWRSAATRSGPARRRRRTTASGRTPRP